MAIYVRVMTEIHNAVEMNSLIHKPDEDVPSSVIIA